MTPSPVLISLPDGLSISGVTLWALRLAGVLAPQGRQVAILAHAGPSDVKCLEAPPGVEVVRIDAPPLHEANGNLAPYIGPYRDTLRRLARSGGGWRPVVYLPTLVGDSFGIGAALSLADPELIRMVGWQHADIPYDARVLANYEPVLAAMVGVSRVIADRLTSAIPSRASNIFHLPNAVQVGAAPPERLPLRGRPLRLVYTGRLEHKQKRVTALIHLSDELAERGVDHTLTIAGEGPADAELREMARRAERGTRITFAGVLAPSDVRALLRESDCFVLMSRYEGLSVAMLEAMATGCIPIVSHVASGADEVVTDDLNGVLVPAAPEAPDEAVAKDFADGVERVLQDDVSSMSMGAWRTARESYCLDRYCERVSTILDRAAAAPARSWPASRPCAFTGSTTSAGGSGTVPADGAARMTAMLTRLADATIVLHGGGRHTIELASVLGTSGVRIAAIVDDDPQRWGSNLFGWPIIAPNAAAETGATDVVISSWLHADEIYARRATYERQGMRVHHLYREGGGGPAGSRASATVDSHV